MNIHRTTLSNDLPLIVVPVEGTQAVTTLLFVGSGSVQEDDDVAGVAHFLEHMMFKGTERRPSKRALAEELDVMGAEYNAFTFTEFTGYYIKAAAEHHERSMDVLSDMVMHSQYTEEAVDQERNVIIEELRMYQDDPQQFASSILIGKSMFAGHPLQRPIIGHEETLQSMQRSSVVSFWEEHYRAQNAALIVVGAVETTEVEHRAEQWFGSFTGGGSVHEVPFHTEQEQPRVIADERDTDQAHFVWGVPGVHITEDRQFAAWVASVVLGGMMSSRLFLEIREKRGLAYYVRSSNQSWRNYGMFFTRAGVKKDKLQEAVDIVVRELRTLKQTPIPQAELQKAKDHIKGSLALRLEESNEIAFLLAEHEVLRGEILTVDDIFSRVESVTAEDVQAIAKELFLPERMNIAVVAPTVEEGALRDTLSAV